MVFNHNIFLNARRKPLSKLSGFTLAARQPSSTQVTVQGTVRTHGHRRKGQDSRAELVRSEKMRIVIMFSKSFKLFFL